MPTTFCLEGRLKKRYNSEGKLFRNPLYASMTLIKTNVNVLVDTGGRTDGKLLVKKLGGTRPLSRRHRGCPDGRGWWKTRIADR